MNHLDFLIELNKRLHYVEKVEQGFYKGYFYDTYTNEKMTKEEIERVLETSQKLNFVIYPINTALGFSVGYDVCKINYIGKKKVLLRFKESQLPEGYNFERMSEIFMKKSNLTKAKIINEEIVNEYDYYDY